MTCYLKTVSHSYLHQSTESDPISFPLFSSLFL
jgi:hypothetical protein